MCVRVGRRIGVSRYQSSRSWIRSRGRGGGGNFRSILSRGRRLHRLPLCPGGGGQLNWIVLPNGGGGVSSCSILTSVLTTSVLTSVLTTSILTTSILTSPTVTTSTARILLTTWVTTVRGLLLSIRLLLAIRLLCTGGRRWRIVSRILLLVIVVVVVVRVVGIRVRVGIGVGPIAEHSSRHGPILCSVVFDRLLKGRRRPENVLGNQLLVVVRRLQRISRARSDLHLGAGVQLHFELWRAEVRLNDRLSLGGHQHAEAGLHRVVVVVVVAVGVGAVRVGTIRV